MFIKKNKIENLFINGGGKVNIDDLIKLDHLKFIFDNTTKDFLFKINGVFTKI